MTAEPVAAIPITRSCPYAPPPEHVRLRAEPQPVVKVTLPDGTPVWAVTRLKDVRTMLGDPRLRFSKHLPGVAPPSGGPEGDHFPLKAPVINELPPEQHMVARRALLGDFTVKQVASLEPRVQQIVDEHIDAMLAGPRPVDLVEAFSLPVPSLVICELLGVPYADHEFFQERSARAMNHAVPAEERGRAVFELIAYLDELVAAKEKDPADDLLSRQIFKQREDGAVDHDALASLACALLTAGHETTASMISLSVLTLLQHPDKLAAIKQDPSKTPAAIEELLRYYTIAEGVNRRYATEDMEFLGVHIKKGEWLVALTNTANRDPEVFDDPDEFDIERGARHHLAFGFGPHGCLGQNLARLELRVAIDTLFRRIPGLKPAVPVEELPFRDTDLVYGMRAFPVIW
jgi:cytochrome P450